ncbi:MAG: alpha-L-rhamnosidase N-terminal domain-containing protein, partial [Planctomycetes bacterium]|nr:alpha-L-rhamnosidase N-terminal domain-containing protein [Planctomycetota bacterium]
MTQLVMLTMTKMKKRTQPKGKTLSVLSVSALIFLILAIQGSYASGFTPKFSIDSKEYTPKSWKAKWIWNTESEDNQVLLARKTFDYQKTTKAHLYITAESHYKLWINGQFVSRGPARSASHHQSFDIFEVSNYLLPGKNTIAVQVHFHGIMNSYYNKQIPGLLVQLNDQDGEPIMISDKSWKAKRDRGWDSRTEVVNSVNSANYSGCYDFSKASPGWHLNSYDDSNWPKVIYQTVKSWPSTPKEPYALQKPWFSLVARDLPPLKEYDKRPQSILEILEAPQYAKYPQWGPGEKYNALKRSTQDIHRPLKRCKVKGVEAFMRGEGPLLVKNSYPDTKWIRQPLYHTTIIFDFGKIHDGYPKIKIKGGKGAIVDINYAPYLLDGVFHPSIIQDNF